MPDVDPVKPKVDPKPNPNPDPGGQGDGGGGTGDPGGQADPKDGGQAKPGASGGTGNDKPAPGERVEDLPEWAQKKLKNLNSENANARTENNVLKGRVDKIETGFKSMFGDEDDKLTPEEKMAKVQLQNESMATQNAMLELCMENGITDAKGRKYLTFLINESVDDLKEGEELSEEAMTGLIQQAKQFATGKKANSSADDGGEGGDPPNPQNTSDVTLAAFNAMNALDRNKLYLEKLDTYTKLVAEAKKAGKFV